MSRLLLVFALASVGTVAAQQPEGCWAQAEADIRRLSPETFHDAPRALREHLLGIGCRVPQAWIIEKPHNFISGEFQRPGQTDWAVLCSVGSKSKLLVFWRGDPDRGETLSEDEDSLYLQVVSGDGTIGFSHVISAVGKQYILDHYEAYGDEDVDPGLPPTIDHQGINDAFAEKASTVLYWYESRWLGLPGAD